MPATHSFAFFYDPARIMYVLTPKCGSTTLFGIFAAMAGIEVGQGKARDAVARAVEDGRLAEKGLSVVRADTNDALVRLRETRPDHRLMANVRNPYARAVSNYHNKLNRYAKAFDPEAYRYGKLRQILEGPRAWNDGNRACAHIQTQISFMDFLNGLEANGADFDTHFTPQSTLLALNRLRYDRLQKLETFDAEFVSAMEAAGVPPEAFARLKALPRSNATPYTAPESDLLTPEAKAIIARIYAADFALLGYPA